MTETPARSLVGRAREVARLERALADRTGVLVCGPPGIGKTSLVEALLAPTGATVVRARASTSTKTAPLAAFAGALRGDRPADQARVDLVAHLTEVVAATAGADGIVFCDDVHHFDDAAAMVVAELATGPGPLVIATARTGRGLPDAIAGLWEAGLLVRIDLEPLTEAHSAALLAQLVDGRVDPAAERAIIRIAAGVPMTLRELVLAAVADGSLVEERGLWRLTRPLQPGQRLVEIVERRIAGLADKERLVLDFLALGAPLGLTDLEALTSGAAVEAVDEAGFLAIADDGRRTGVRLAHPLHEETLRAALPASRRRRLAGRLADQLEAHGMRRDDDVGRLARWGLLSGRALAPDLLVAAARQARFEHDYEPAEALARAAVLAGAGPVAHGILGEVLYVAGRPEEADAVLAACPATTDHDRTVIAVQRAAVRFWALDDAAGTSDLLLAAADRVGDPHAGELRASAAQYDHLAGRPGDALAALLPHLDHRSPRTFLQAATAAAPALALAGRTAEADAILEQAGEVWRSIGDQLALFDPGILLVCASLDAMEAGRLAEAADHARFGHEIALAQHTSVGQAWMALALGRTLLLQGRLAEADARFAEAVSAAGTAFPGLGRWGIASQLQVAGLQGDAARCTNLDLELAGAPGTALQMLEPEVLVAQAWSAAVSGRAPDAAAHLGEAVELALDMGAPVLAVEALHEAVRLGVERTVVTSARRAAVEARLTGSDSLLVAARIAHLTARRSGNASQVEAAAIGFEAIGMDLHGAESWAEAARLHAHAGDLHRADLAGARRAAALARCSGAPSTPGLASGRLPAALTRREREVVDLAARRLTSKEIAARLGLRPRTVDNHLHRAYDKLGISGKADLVDPG